MTGRVFIPSPLRLVLKEDASAPGGDTGDPFEQIAYGALPYRAYRASLESEGRPVVRGLTLLMEPNEYVGPRSPGSQPAMTNPQAEAVWQEALRSHRALSSRAVVALEENALPPPATGDGPSHETIRRHPPLAYCRKVNKYLTPVCPSCLGVLSTCQDEALLRRVGLPSYSASLTRFLYCAVCSADSTRPPTFYTFALRGPETPSEGVRLRRRSELYRDLAPRVHLPPAGTPVEHACFSCEHRATCYPQGRRVDEPIPAEALLFPLAYYDFHWLPLEALPLDFEEAAALLGGDAPRRQAPAALERAGSQFFFEGDPSGLFALEALHLKLAALAEVARGACTLLEQAGHPHLALAPERIRAAFSEGTPSLPARWGLALKIADLVTTAPMVQPEEDRIPGEPRVYTIPYPLPEAFLPAAMARPQTENLWMRLTVKDLQVDSTGGEKTARLEAELVSELYRESEHGRHDLVRLAALIPGAGAEKVFFSGAKGGVIPGGFLFSGASGPLPAEVASSLDPARTPKSWSVEATIIHSFGAPAEVMSLGFLMLRLLLANDRQEAGRFGPDLVERLTRSLSEAASGDAGVDDMAQRTRLREALAREGIAAGPDQVLFRAVDRQALPAAVPPALWEESLLLALRMASNQPVWSVCARQDDFPLQDPAAPLRRVVEEIDGLTERARGALIGSHGRNVVVQEVCDDFLADVAEALSPGTPPPGPDALEMTMVASPRRPAS